MDDFVSTEWLAEQLGADDLAIVDCTAFLPTTPRDAKAEFLQAHIPGARFLDIAEVADHAHPAPHMLPSRPISARRWSGSASAGTSGSSSMTTARCAPRRAAGSCSVTSARRRSRSSTAASASGSRRVVRSNRARLAAPRPHVRASEAADEVVSKDDILAGTDLEIVDARSTTRFTGEDPDPRPNVAAGHIPGAKCLPMSALYRDDGTFREPGRNHRFIRRSWDRSGAAVHRQLRLGRHRQQFAPRRPPGRRRQRQALRWQLE